MRPCRLALLAGRCDLGGFLESLKQGIEYMYLLLRYRLFHARDVSRNVMSYSSSLTVHLLPFKSSLWPAILSHTLGEDISSNWPYSEGQCKFSASSRKHLGCPSAARSLVSAATGLWLLQQTG